MPCNRCETFPWPFALGRKTVEAPGYGAGLFACNLEGILIYQ